MRLVTGEHKMSRFPHSPIRIINIYVKALTGFSRAYHPDGLKTTFSLKAVPLKTASTAGTMQTVGRRYIPRTGDR